MNDQRDDDDDDDNEVEYKPGSIVKVVMHNFMTHSDAVIQPKQRLNIVIGANGTGKSTVLNAICLGLGGDPKLLGRADQLHSFVRHNCESGWIEITLAPHPGEETHVLKRIFSSDESNKKGICFINGNQVKLKELQHLVINKYNISIDNLCTFLPQDRVGDFSGLTDQQRLIETQKTWPGQFCYKTHLELIEAEEKIVHSAGQVDTVKKEVDRLQRELEPMEREKERMEDRRKAEEQAKLLKQKLVWLEFEDVRTKAIQAKDDKANAKAAYEAAEQDFEPLRDEVNRLGTHVKTAEGVIRNMDANIQRHNAEMKKQVEKFTKHDDEIETLMNEIMSLSQVRQKRKDEYQKCLEQLNALRESFAQAESEEELQKEFELAAQAAKTSRKEYENVRRNVATLTEQFEEAKQSAVSLQEKLAKVRDHDSQRRQAVLRADPNVAKIANYIEQHRNEFRRPVYGPIAAEITMKDQSFADYLEFHTPNNVLKAFVVETKEDQKRLYDITTKVLKVPSVMTIHVKDGRLEPITRIFSEQKMQNLKRDHGIAGYLDETFTAPDSVLQGLRSFASVHQAVVGTEKSQASVDKHKLLDIMRAPEQSGGKPTKFCLFTRGQDRGFRYTVNTSRGGFANMKQDDITRRANMLSTGANPQVEKDLQDSLEAAHREMENHRPALQEAQAQEVQLRDTSNEARVAWTHAKSKLDAIGKVQQKVKRAELKVKDAENALKTEDGPEKEKLLKTLTNRQTNSIKALELHAQTRRLLMECMVLQAAATLDRRKAQAAQQMANDELKEKEEHVNSLRSVLVSMSEKYARYRQLAKDKKTLAERVAPLQDENGEMLPLKEQLEALEVATVEEAEAALEEAEAVVNSIHENSGIFRQLEELQAKFAEAKSKLDDLTINKDALLDAINSKKNLWESKVVKHVGELDKKFGKYMKEMDCSGSVELKRANVNEFNNFKDWGIEIKVSFRDGADAQVLSKHRHSGGERSVATILYLMALQDAMAAPFRCVDEINQGLDERNERLVFKRIVANSTCFRKNDPNDHTGQYFLITPKLLHDLEGMEQDGIEVHTVFNGAYNFQNPTDGDVMEYLKTLRVQRKRSVSSTFGGDENDENSSNGVRRPRHSRVRA